MCRNQKDEEHTNGKVKKSITLLAGVALATCPSARTNKHATFSC